MTPAVGALESALVSLTRADGEAFRLRAAATLLARATHWQSRAADAYRDAVGEWLAEIDAVAAELDAVTRAVRAERLRLIDLAGAH